VMLAAGGFDPAPLVGLTVCAYWACVGVMVLRVRRRARKLSRVLVPKLAIERLMWLVWVPLIVAWMALPFVAVGQDPTRHPYLALPAFAVDSYPLLVVRWSASVLGVVCLALSILCWSHMGRDWRMGIDPSLKTRLIVDGPFARVRHPIYSLSMLLMACTVVGVPTLPVLMIALAHIGLMHLKARNEERFLLSVHGDAYASYCVQTGRFFPRVRRSSPRVSANDVARVA
jgi:protein-S-isoprenylcysteine O-methyltransferase Ste14